MNFLLFMLDFGSIYTRKGVRWKIHEDDQENVSLIRIYELNAKIWFEWNIV